MPEIRWNTKLVIHVLLAVGTLVLLKLSSSMPLPKGKIVGVLAWFGGVTFFFGHLMTGSGFQARGRYVNTPTPVEAWKVFGVVLWILAIACLIFME